MQEKITNANPQLVLVVDDDQTTGKLLRHNLENTDTHIMEATTGLDCIKILHEANVDLILLDIKLPDFNGWGILSLLRLTQSLSNIPVIVVTLEAPDKALLEQFKPDDFIQKPFDIRDLLIRVRKVMAPLNYRSIAL